MKVYTKKGTAYTLKEEPFGEGGESKVYRVEGRPAHCAKIYKNPKPEQEEKLTAMVNENFNGMVEGRLLFAWPQKLLYDVSGKFVGYLMPYDTGKPLFAVMRPGERNKIFHNGRYDWSYSVAIAYHLAWLMEYAHQRGYVVGDCNAANFLVRKDGSLIVIDVDSFEFTDKKTGRHYRTGVGVPEFVPPELQGANLSRRNFTEQSDNFALAVHIFQLLVGCHPFSVKVQTDYRRSTPFNEQSYNIVHGVCPWFRDDLPGVGIPLYALELNALPARIRTAFRQTFSYNDATVRAAINKRVDAGVWKMLLLNLYERRKTFLVCPVNPEHRYLPDHSKGCPFCAAEHRVNECWNRIGVGGASAQTSAGSNQPQTPPPTQRIITPTPAKAAPSGGKSGLLNRVRSLFSH